MLHASAIAHAFLRVSWPVMACQHTAFADFYLKHRAQTADIENVTPVTTAAPDAVLTTPFSHSALDGSPTLAFQPAVDLSDGRLLGLEALLRWHDSSGDDVPPGLLIPRACLLYTSP